MADTSTATTATAASTTTSTTTTTDTDTTTTTCTLQEKKRKKKPSLSPQSTAMEICGAFFQALDLDGNGMIEHAEIRIMGMVAFDETEDEANARWERMLKDMDTNGDQMISKEEYIAWWTCNMKDKLEADGLHFVPEYASYLLKGLLRITSVKTASNLCDAFFQAMDENGDGFLVEDEIKNISKWAFGAKQDQAHKTWLKMKDEMDTNKDGKISREEYSTYWLAECKGKIQPETGKFIPDYQKYLLHKLGKLRAGKKRQDQLKVWEQNKEKEKRSLEGRDEKEDSPSKKKQKKQKSRRISFTNDIDTSGKDKHVVINEKKPDP